MSDLANLKHELWKLQSDVAMFARKFRDERAEFVELVGQVRARYQEAERLMEQHERDMAEFLSSKHKRLSREKEMARLAELRNPPWREKERSGA
jgi:hypothetical protein